MASVVPYLPSVAVAPQVVHPCTPSALVDKRRQYVKEVVKVYTGPIQPKEAGYWDTIAALVEEKAKADPDFSRDALNSINKDNCRNDVYEETRREHLKGPVQQAVDWHNNKAACYHTTHWDCVANKVVALIAADRNLAKVIKKRPGKIVCSQVASSLGLQLLPKEPGEPRQVRRSKPRDESESRYTHMRRDYVAEMVQILGENGHGDSNYSKKLHELVLARALSDPDFPQEKLHTITIENCQGDKHKLSNYRKFMNPLQQAVNEHDSGSCSQVKKDHWSCVAKRVKELVAVDPTWHWTGSLPNPSTFAEIAKHLNIQLGSSQAVSLSPALQHVTH